MIVSVLSNGVAFWTTMPGWAGPNYAGPYPGCRSPENTGPISPGELFLLLYKGSYSYDCEASFSIWQSYIGLTPFGKICQIWVRTPYSGIVQKIKGAFSSRIHEERKWSIL